MERVGDVIADPVQEYIKMPRGHIVSGKGSKGRNSGTRTSQREVPEKMQLPGSDPCIPAATGDNEDFSKGLAHTVRDQGRFGSHSMGDDYSEDSRP